MGLVRTSKHALTLLEIISLPARLWCTPTQIVNLKVVAPQLRFVFVSAVSSYVGVCQRRNWWELQGVIVNRYLLERLQRGVGQDIAKPAHY